MNRLTLHHLGPLILNLVNQRCHLISYFRFGLYRNVQQCKMKGSPSIWMMEGNSLKLALSIFYISKKSIYKKSITSASFNLTYFFPCLRIFVTTQRHQKISKKNIKKIKIGIFLNKTQFSRHAQV